MRAIVRKWGNSASVRIPKAILKAAHIELDAAVDVREEDGRIVIAPVREPAVSLDALLNAITPENQHGEVDFGVPVGKEAF